MLVLAICGNIGALLILYKSEYDVNFKHLQQNNFYHKKDFTFSYRVSRKSTKLYLTSLALCDLLLAIFSPPVDISQLLSRYRSWVINNANLSKSHIAKPDEKNAICISNSKFTLDIRSLPLPLHSIRSSHSGDRSGPFPCRNCGGKIPLCCSSFKAPTSKCSNDMG